MASSGEPTGNEPKPVVGVGVVEGLTSTGLDPWDAPDPSTLKVAAPAVERARETPAPPPVVAERPSPTVSPLDPLILPPTQLLGPGGAPTPAPTPAPAPAPAPVRRPPEAPAPAPSPIAGRTIVAPESLPPVPSSNQPPMEQAPLALPEDPDVTAWFDDEVERPRRSGWAAAFGVAIGLVGLAGVVVAASAVWLGVELFARPETAVAPPVIPVIQLDPEPPAEVAAVEPEPVAPVVVAPEPPPPPPAPVAARVPTPKPVVSKTRPVPAATTPEPRVGRGGKAGPPPATVSGRAPPVATVRKVSPPAPVAPEPEVAPPPVLEATEESPWGEVAAPPPAPEGEEEAPVWDQAPAGE